MPWVEVFAAFVVCHSWATICSKPIGRRSTSAAGLGRTRCRAARCVSHIVTYTLAFVPALDLAAPTTSGPGRSAWPPWSALPHMVQDDGRLLAAYIRA